MAMLYGKGEGLMKFDAIVVGAGLAGLVATAEMADAGKKCCFWTRSRKTVWAARPGGRLAGYF